MGDKIILEGAISVKAAVEAGNRDVYCVYTDKDKRSKDFGYICRKASEKGIETKRVPAEEISEMTEGNSHGGICAVAGERKFVESEKLFDCENPFIVLLEGIEDPYNFGYAVRSVYAAGATGLIVPSRNWMSADKVVTRASAGATEFIPTSSVSDFVPFLQKAKEKGLKIVAADRKDATDMYETRLDMPLVLAIGGALRGLSAPVYEMTDTRIYIPYGNNFRNSLSATGASAAIAFEIYRQRAKYGNIY